VEQSVAYLAQQQKLPPHCWPRWRVVCMPVLGMRLKEVAKMALQQIEIPVRGMEDCAGCCNSVQKALTALPGVQ
jgi:hypothetical protein